MRKRSGVLHREIVSASTYNVYSGVVDEGSADTSEPQYTGIIWFEYDDGASTRKYRESNAPRWMRTLLSRIRIHRGE
jgi:hypothetical protein